MEILSIIIIITIIIIKIAQLQRNIKECPYCQSRIHKNATICKYCRKEL